MNLEQLTQGLNPDQTQEFVDALSYLTERLDNDQGTSPEGTSAAILNRLSPAVRQRFQMLSEFIEQPRALPFQPKRSEAQNMDALGLDAYNGGIVKDSLDGLEVSGRLQQRMGTDRQRKQEPITRREMISAALNASNYPEQ